MQRNRFPAFLKVLLAAIFATASVGAQAPAPDATVHTQDGSVIQRPEPHPDIPKLTPDEQQTQMKAQSARLAELQLQNFGRQLHLTPIQIEKMRPILDERTKELRAIAATEGDVLQQRLKAREVQKAAQEKIKGVLNPEQRQLYERMLEMHNTQRARRSTEAAQRRRVITGAPSAPDAPAAPATQEAPGTPAAPASAPTAPAEAPAAPAAPPAPPQSK